MEFNPENRNVRLYARSCSFCRRPGHNISRCNNEKLIIFENSCLMVIRADNINVLQRFREFLLSEALHDPNLVRAFAIRKCEAITRSNMDNCIEGIIRYFTPHIRIMENEQNRISEEPQEPQEPQESQESEVIRNLIRRNTMSLLVGQSEQTISEVMLFMDMIIYMREMMEENNFNRKFNIKTTISENKDCLNGNCECNICYDDHSKKEFVKLDCRHEFCKNCIKKSLQNEKRKTYCCALCRSEIKNFEIYDENIQQELNDLISDTEFMPIQT